MENNSTHYGNSSFKFFIYSIIVILALVIQSFQTIEIAEHSRLSQFLSIFLTLTFVFLWIMTCYYSVMSVVKKEQSTVFKIIGIIGSTILLLILTGLISFITIDLFG